MTRPTALTRQAHLLATASDHDGYATYWLATHFARSPLPGLTATPAPVAGGERAVDYDLDPYPGRRPSGSYVIDTDQTCWPVTANTEHPSGWHVQTPTGQVCLDKWLTSRDAPTLAARVPVLCYGSNVSPGKVIAINNALPAVQLACTITGLASVWCAGDTAEGRTPLTLAAVPGHTETATVMMCTPTDLTVLDRVKGRTSGRYELVTLEHGQVLLDNGETMTRPAVYVGRNPDRQALLVDGRPVFRVDVDHRHVRLLRDRIPTSRAADHGHVGPAVPEGTHPSPAPTA